MIDENNRIDKFAIYSLNKELLYSPFTKNDIIPYDTPKLDGDKNPVAKKLNAQQDLLVSQMKKSRASHIGTSGVGVKTH